VPLHLPQDSVTKDQPLEQAEGAFYPAISDGHLQWTVARRAPIGPAKALTILSIPKAHEASPASSRQP